ncbi:unnamed protein product, partial [Mesorhabditis belari]|uniref:Acyl-coenzyme A oxidase n=1 Tax=Mesorhabditis belari TaxID=2138241 RepID=A0A915H262_9BILA
MSLNSYIRPGDNPDLTEEREKGIFPTNEMTQVIHGRELSERRKQLTAYIERSPALHDAGEQAFMTREEKYEDASRKMAEIFKKIKEIGSAPGEESFAHIVNEVIGIDGHPLALQQIMFIPSLLGQADEALLAKFGDRAKRGEIIGTYAQTEMGHGTNLRFLETTAHFDKATQEFIINSPTTSSIKWWPGNLGKSSNYAIVAAQLFLDGKKMGPHNFLVQLRDEKTHMPMKGVMVGDIGPKFSYNTTDNGFLKLDHVRIPRSQMLMRHAKVQPDGTYVKPPHAKIGYAAMVHVRAYMIRSQAHFLALATTIAIRYSATRRQGEIKPGAGEVKILDYQTQQHRLFPQIARTYAYYFAGSEVLALYKKTLEMIKEGDVTLMADLHAVTSGMKAVVSFEVGQGVEQCRMACGGHGYSAASRFPEIYGVQIGGVTYEGENMVMLLQLARYLMKAAEQAKKGEKLSPLTEYLNKKNGKSQLCANSANNAQYLIEAFEHIARRLVLRAFDRMNSLRQKGLSKEDAWQANAVEMNRASRAHTRLFIARAFYNRLHTNKVDDKRIHQVLTDLCFLFLNYELLDMSHYLLEDNYMSADQIGVIRESVYNQLKKIRPNAVSLVDSYDISDRELRSVLGRRDGNVYENLLKWAKANPLNKEEVLPGFAKHLQPMMERARENSKL